MSYTIGIDLGTTNTKAIALSDNEDILYELSVKTEITSVPTGGEQTRNGLRMTWSAFCAGLSRK